MFRKLVCIICTALCFTGVFYGLAGCTQQPKVISRYEITVEYMPDNATLAGTTKITFENASEEEISVLKFQLYPNAYRQDALYAPVSKGYETAAYYQGESYGEMVISSVNGAKNWEVMGEDENILYVYLERSLFPGEEVVLDIGFLLKLANVNHRTGITPKTVNLGNFFPILCGIKNGGFVECVYYSDGDPFYSDCADYKVTLTTPKEYLVAATGEIVSERALESKKEYTMSATNVRDFAMVLSENYRQKVRIVNGKTIAYYYYDDAFADKTLETAVEAFTYFEETFGKYPYEKYTLAQTGFCVGGMEYPALTMLSDGLLPEETARAVVHETAHQWWYAAVGNDQLENAWQDEGLAEYSALTFFENYEKYGYTREVIVQESLQQYRSYYDVYGSVLGRSDTVMIRHLKDFISDYEYRCIAYDKSVIMFDTLRKSVGDDKFFDGLKKYYKENLYQIATPDALIGAFERCGLDVRGFFESFLEGKAVL